MTYEAADDGYDAMTYRRCGRSGLKLPAISLGLWHNFGHDRPYETQRAICRRAFDRGVTHFDLANNYDPPYRRREVRPGSRAVPVGTRYLKWPDILLPGDVGPFLFVHLQTAISPGH